MDVSERLKIRAFVEGLLTEHDDHAPFADDSSLVRAGRIDSLAVTRLVMFLESAYGVDFDRIEFDPERLDTIAGIAAVVEEWRRLG
jgi:acyl carrier protein